MAETKKKCIKPLVVTVVKTVKYLLSQLAINRYFAMTVLAKIEVGMGLVDPAAREQRGETVGGLERKPCIKPLVMNVVKVAKYLLNQQAINQFIVVSVLVKAVAEVTADNQANN